MWRSLLKHRRNILIGSIFFFAFCSTFTPAALGLTAEKALSILNTLKDDPVTSYSPYSRNTRAKELIAIVRPLVNHVKYRWGGTMPETGLDCSAFVQWVFKRLGKAIPRTSRQQSKAGQYIPPGIVDTGDIVFFSTKGSSWSEINHCGVMIDDEHFAHCTSGEGVIITKAAQYPYPILFGRRY